MWLVDGIVVAIVSSNCWFFIPEKWDVFRGGTFHFYLRGRGRLTCFPKGSPSYKGYKDLHGNDRQF